jgi:hypothetical protein
MGLTAAKSIATLNEETIQLKTDSRSGKGGANGVTNIFERGQKSTWKILNIFTIIWKDRR